MKTCIAVLSVLLILCVTACPEPEEDYNIGEITIYNIPANIPVLGKSAIISPTFKVYLNASNSMSADDEPEAKGLALISSGVSNAVSQTYSVTMQLQNPNPPDEPDPNYDTGPWSGTALFFSIMISPQYVTEDEDNIIWVKAGTTLDKGKSRIDWSASPPLINFRNPDLPGTFAGETRSLYEEIILKDDDIIK